MWINIVWFNALPRVTIKIQPKPFNLVYFRSAFPFFCTWSGCGQDMNEKRKCCVPLQSPTWFRILVWHIYVSWAFYRTHYVLNRDKKNRHFNDSASVSTPNAKNFPDSEARDLIRFSCIRLKWIRLYDLRHTVIESFFFWNNTERKISTLFQLLWIYF